VNLVEDKEAEDAKIDGAIQHLGKIGVIADELGGDKVEHRQRCKNR
jgi:hypothetical protein